MWMSTNTESFTMNRSIEMFKAHVRMWELSQVHSLCKIHVEASGRSCSEQRSSRILSGSCFLRLHGSSSPNQNFHKNISNCHRYCGEIDIKMYLYTDDNFGENFGWNRSNHMIMFKAMHERHTKLLIDFKCTPCPLCREPWPKQLHW